MSTDWQPIETAPRDKKILAGRWYSFYNHTTHERIDQWWMSATYILSSQDLSDQEWEVWMPMISPPDDLKPKAEIPKPSWLKDGR